MEKHIKYILGSLAVLAIAAVAAWNVNLNSQKNELSDILLANVEALAQESDWLRPCPNTYGTCRIEVGTTLMVIVGYRR
jgi:hypothetical protein